MGLFPPFLKKKKSFFSPEEEESIVNAIRLAEKKTSGEIRLFIETHCKFLDPIDRAKELFLELEMFKTKDRNGVLLYFAMKDKQVAIWGDEGIHQKLGQAFWNAEINTILTEFKEKHFVEGICHMIQDVGNALQTNFPFEKGDNNELSDEILFGK